MTDGLTVLAAGVRRLLVPNASMMTGPGTNSYLVGEDAVAVIDPGPAIPTHIEKLQRVSPGPIRWILVTHTHPDHSPGAHLLAQQTGALLLGQPPPVHGPQDRTFEPDRVLQDGDILETDEFTLSAIHTPGHASNHLCYLHTGLSWVFTGDHIVNGMTVVIDPPDGNVKDYLSSLSRLRNLKVEKLVPGHGDVLEEPEAAVDWLIDHRLQREDRVVEVLSELPGANIEQLVPGVYADVNPRLHRLAMRSLLAHLLKLQEDGRAREQDGRWNLSR